MTDWQPGPDEGFMRCSICRCRIYGAPPGGNEYRCSRHSGKAKNAGALAAKRQRNRERWNAARRTQ